ncbi:spore morphogenesis/germination protein YwcE [Halobacillus salinarum]|uniref:Spore morphogenesis/germination protein YwcE n=1 Tax=Halobacillus salinarum TaxID=2932257 RepID=A0ABY4EV10_9BACI|nr:spore morphogenesis/germination protein YwcE [Halobacillus salinarum]UOQ45986.1 spore morphogenesis/germination protein YwcE [Halobacillus salinarum]
MDVILVYVLLASMTPLFLWMDHRKLAIVQMPFIVAMWAYFVIEFGALEVGAFAYRALLTLFAANIILAHYAMYLVLYKDVKIRKRISAAPNMLSRVLEMDGDKSKAKKEPQ